MRMLICGTAAAEGWPALFCKCDPCKRARELGGKNVRSRAAYMLGERVRVDFGPDSNMHMQKYRLEYDKLEHLVVTHSHDDHWFPTDLAYRRRGFSSVPDHLLTVWGNEAVEKTFVDRNGDDWLQYKARFNRIAAWQPFDLCDGLTATPILAAHDRNEECVNYLFQLEGRTTLIGHDTGWYDEATWEFVSGRPMRLVLMDCTYGPDNNNGGHLSCQWVVKARDEMAKRGALTPDNRFLATHFSHNGGALHEELVEWFAPHGIEVAFDGMELEI